MSILGRDAWCVETLNAVSIHQNVESGLAVGVAALEQHRRGASDPSAAPSLHPYLVAVLRFSEQRRCLARFGVINVASGMSFVTGAIDGICIEQRIAARRDHHRIEHDRHAGKFA